MNLVCMFDGGYSVHKGYGAGAAVLFDEAGEVLACRAKFLRAVTTPLAEYTALHLALQLAAEHAGPLIAQTSVVAWGDAELIVRQVDGRYQSKRDSLTAMRDMAHVLMAPFASCQVKELPKAGPKLKRRYGNEKADALATECAAAGEDIDR